MNRGVAALLLAAGKSSRMGRCKQLLPLGNETVIARCLGTLQCGGVRDITVVVSEGGRDVAEAAEAFSARVVVNRDSGGDMASSVRAGRAAVAEGFSGVIVALCDYPLVTPDTIAFLIRQHAEFPDCIIVPEYQNRNGHPLLFPRMILDELGDGMILRDVVRKDSARLHTVPVDDPGILIDMDTPDAYMRIRSMATLAGSTEIGYGPHVKNIGTPPL